MTSDERVFVQVYRRNRADPAPRRLQLKSTVRFRNVLRTLGGTGDLYWHQKRLAADDCPHDVGMRGSLDHPVKLVFEPAPSPRAAPQELTSGPSPSSQHAPSGEDRLRSLETARGKPKLLSPDPAILLSRRCAGSPQEEPNRPLAAPSRLVSPAPPIGVHAARAPAVSSVTPTYPTEAAMYTPRVLWFQSWGARPGPSADAAHTYGDTEPRRHVDCRMTGATVQVSSAPRRNAPILQPPDLVPELGVQCEPAQRTSPEVVELNALQSQVRAIQDELRFVRASVSPPVPSAEATLAMENSPLPRWTTRSHWRSAPRLSSVSPSARNPYLVDELADELHQAQLLRLAALRRNDMLT